jgi:ABC-type Fe3+ transport system substrate-binding protein
LKVDILGMAERGILQIPPPMIDPKGRNVLAFYSRFQVTAYNKNVLPPSQVSKVWEDLLRPELKGRKFMLDTRAPDISFLVLV